MGVIVGSDKYQSPVDAAKVRDFREKVWALKDRRDNFEHQHRSVPLPS